MKAVVLLALIGLASCNIINLQDVGRDFTIKYSYDDDYDREVEVDYEDRPRTIFRQVAAPIRAAPTVQFRTSSVTAQTAPVQIVAAQTPVFTQRQVVPVAAPQPPVFVQERVVPVVSVPQTNVVTQYVQAQPAPVARTVVQAAPVVRSVVPAVPAPAPAPFVVTRANPTFVTETRRYVSRSSDDSDEE
ncbi:uncharacterized protein [Palaemon carinicauda]|uniref:uncharacterized protein n=1 Tax=Palaemon carinicauda TaxID=392227 RepID=UPI0035B5D069